HRLTRRSQFPNTIPTHMLNTDARKARPILRQNQAGVASQLANTCRTFGELGTSKYGKLLLAKNQLFAAGDIMNVAKGHCTAIKIAKKATPPKSACCQRGASFISGHTRSRMKAGTTSRSGNGSGTMWVMFWYTGPSFGDAGNRGRIHNMSMPNAM